MNFRLWLRIFTYQCLSFILFVSLIFAVLVYQVRIISIEEVFGLMIWGIPLYLVITAILLTLALAIATILTIVLSAPFEHVRARINWLLLGKYDHEIFRRGIGAHSWLDSSVYVAQDIDQLRQKIMEISQDLQEFTAAPVFVGEDTKEEIIEQERNRIGRELHDSVSQQLFAATMMISAISEVADSQALPIGKQIKKVEEIIGNAQTEMRALLLHLRPIELLDQRLDQGIEHLLIELNSKIPMAIHWELDQVKVDSGIEDHLFRIMQEAISNTMRHAKAHKFEVYLNQNANAVQLKIVDDGQGFDYNVAKQKGNYGLRNMEERVRSLGGTFTLLTSPGKGTSITIRIPIAKKEAIV